MLRRESPQIHPKGTCLVCYSRTYALVSGVYSLGLRLLGAGRHSWLSHPRLLLSGRAAVRDDLPAAQCGSKKIIVETLENTANLTRCRQPLIPERYVVVCYVVQCLHKEICFYAHVVQTVNTGGLVAWSDGELAAERSRSHFNASLHSTLTLFASVGRKGLFRR